ncbi:RAMP superfamily CRISPR-associated protein [Saccharolobus sp.]|uniref:RAMP superfamily CRISPR-associated protein n=1 Tax=Saccharolobus sp. TaxID=2100761 RepID=UPI003170B578
MLENYYDIAIKNRAILNLVFDIEEPLHVGERLEGSVKKIVKINISGKLVPFVPAESIKGAFRSIATMIAKRIFENESDQELKDVIEWHEKDTHIKEGAKEKYYESAKNWLKGSAIFYDKKIDELSEDEKLNLYLSQKCPICKLFGSRNMTSKLIFSDGCFKIKEATIPTYTSTSIDRNKGIAKKDHLFSIEYLPSSKENNLSFKIIADNVIPKTKESKLLSQTLRYILIAGLSIGGSKSRGYGLLKLNKEQSVIEVLEFIENPKQYNEMKSNISTLLRKEGTVRKMNIDEYISYLDIHSIKYV